MEDILLDVTLIVCNIEETDDGKVFPYSKIYRIDVDSADEKKFLRNIKDMKEVVHMETTKV